MIRSLFVVLVLGMFLVFSGCGSSGGGSSPSTPSTGGDTVNITINANGGKIEGSSSVTMEVGTGDCYGTNDIEGYDLTPKTGYDCLLGVSTASSGSPTTEYCAGSSNATIYLIWGSGTQCQ